MENCKINVATSYSNIWSKVQPSPNVFVYYNLRRTGESGDTRTIIVITDFQAYQSAFKHDNGQVTTDEAGVIDAAIAASVNDPNNCQKNPNAKNPESFEAAYWQGLINGLQQVQKDNGGNSIGIQVLKANDANKTNYVQVY